jgi:hypothetical protein
MNIIGITGSAGSGKSTVADILVKNHGFVSVALADSMKRFLRDVLQFTDEQLWGPSKNRNAPDKRYPRDHTRAVFHAERCNCCGANLWEDKRPQCYLTPRFALQQLGTEWGRAMFNDIWINAVMRDASQLLAGLRVFDDAEGNSMSTVPVYTPITGLYFVPADDAALFYVGRGPNCKGVVVSDVRYPNELARIRAEGGRIWHRPGYPAAAEKHFISHSSETSLGSDFDHGIDIPWYPALEEVEAFVEVVLAQEKT